MSWDRIAGAREAAGDVGNTTAAHVLLVYATRANDNGEAWPSVRQLVADTGYSERSVSRSSGAPTAPPDGADRRLEISRQAVKLKQQPQGETLLR